MYKRQGLNVDAGIFVSYIGLFSYYNFDNWTYQPSYVSSNTPWFFNGVRLQFFPTDKLKIEPWIVNGWQSYGKFNELPGFGFQVDYRPREWAKLILSAGVIHLGSWSSWSSAMAAINSALSASDEKNCAAMMV